MKPESRYSITKQIVAIVASAALALQPTFAYANPQGGTVSAGSASISQSGNTLDITQTSSKAVINWTGFNIAPGETTQFFQPSSGSIALNRVNSNSASQIDGNLVANGNIIIINQNGVQFGAGSRVDVNGLVATTANISDSDFMNNTTGVLNFNQPGNPNASIINNGTITAAQAGLVGLVAPNVINNGIITANLGRVQLASGDSFTVDLYGDGLMSVAVSPQVASQLVANNGLIQADGGTVQLTAAAGSQIVNSLITVSGEIKTPAVAEQNGEILIYAEGSNAVANNVAANKGQTTGTSEVLVSGTLDASGKGTGQTGGNISVLGDHVGLLAGAMVDASGDAGGGYVKVGGDFHGQGNTPTAIATYVDPNATINASAITSGNGGNVAVWSDNTTQFNGTIEAKGGPNGGNGGFVETSGKIILQMNGMVDASATQGSGGTWLMDPEDVTISTGADSDEQGNPNFIPSGNQVTAVINTTDIVTALNAGTNVTITTGGDTQSGPNGGSITVSSPISATTGTSGSTGNLTLSSYANITVNAPITLGGTGVTGGKLTLDADNANNHSGYIDIEGNITSNNGAITMGGGSGAITAGSGYAWGNAAETTAVAGLSAAGTAGIFIDTGVTISSGSGAIIMNGHGGNTNTSDGMGDSYGFNFGVYNAGTIAGNGGITIYGTGGSNTAASGDTTQEGSNYGILNVNLISASAGTITLNGTGGGTTYSGGSSNTGEGDNEGVDLGGTLTLTSTATASITGQGGTDTGASASLSSQGGGNFGVNLGGALINTAGNINVNGTGGTSTFGSGGTNAGANYGVYLYSDIFATGSAAVSVTGTGGTQSAQGSNGRNYGVYGAGVIDVVNGTITINGTAASSLGANSIGAYLLGGTLTSSGSGNISITGTGSTTDTTSGDIGVELVADTNTNSTGTLTVIGTGGGGSGSTGGNNFGIELAAADSDSSHAAMTFTGTAGPSGSVGTSTDIYLNDAHVGGGTTGNITFNANTLSLTGSLYNTWIDASGASIVTFAPRTASTSIGLSGGAGTLQVTQALMDDITAPTVVVGALTDTGALTTGAFNWEYLLTTLKLEEGGAAGSITIGGNITKGVDDNGYTNTTAGTLDLYSGSNIIVNNAISSSSTYGALNLYIDSNYANASSGFIDIEGNITTNNGSITMGGGSAAISAGTGYAWGNSALKYGVVISNTNDATISSGTGKIIINGHGYNNALGNPEIGVYFGPGSVNGAILETSSGNITINGIGGNGNFLDVGIYNEGEITTTSGAISLTGTGGTSGSGSTYLDNYGIDNEGTISSTCTSSCGAMTIIGTGANAYSNNYGIYQDGTLTTKGANLTITGTGGAGTSTGNYGTDITSAITGTGAGTITINGTGGGGAAPIYLGANVTNDNAAITFNNAATLAGNVTINAGTGTTTFASTVDGGDTLTVTDSGGAVIFDSKVGGTTALTSLTTTGNTTLDGNVTTTGVQIYNSAVTLGAADTLTTTNSNVTFGSTLDGAYALVVASGTGTDTYTGVAGGGTPLTSINDSSATGTTAIDASITTTGTQNYAGAVTLGGDATLTTTNSNVTFGTTVNGAHNLAVTAGTGNVTYTGIVGGSAVLTSLNDSSSTGTSVLDGNVTTTGAQSYAGTVTLGNNDTLTTTNSNVTFGGAVNGTHTLTIAQGSGTTTFAGNVGTGTALSTINDSGTGTIDLDGNITTSNASATLHGPVLLGGNSTISLGTGTFTTGSTVNGDFNLNATAATFSLGGAIGGSTPLNNVTLTSTNALTLPAISAVTLTASTSAAATDITVGGALALSGTSGNDVSLSAYRNITDNASVTTQGGSIIFDANNANASSGYIDIEANLTSNNGSITMGGGSAAISAGTGYAWGNAGETSAVAGLSGYGITAGVFIDSGVTVSAGSGNIIMNGHGGNTNTRSSGTSEGQNYGATTLGTISTTGGVTIYGIGGTNTANSGDSIQVGENYGILEVSSTISAGNGGITLNGTGGGTTFSGSPIGAAGENYGIYLATGTLQTTGTGTITITGAGGTQSIAGTSGENYGTAAICTISVVNGAITLNGTGGSTGSNNYGTEFGLYITSTGTGTITINGTGGNGAAPILLETTIVTSDNTAVSFNDAVTLGGNSVVNAGTGLLTFASTVDGAFSLTVTGGPVDFDAAIGSGTALASLSATSATGINLDGSVTTTGTQTYTGPAVIGANDTMTTTNSAVDFTSTVNDGTSNTHSLTVSAGSGLITFGGSVGTTELASLSATSTTGIDVNGSVTTGGTQSYTGAVVIGGNDTLTTTNSAVDFTSTINDGTSNTHSLTVSAGNGLITFGGTVGTTELASLAATSTTGIDINGSVTTGGTQTYTGPAVIGANDTLTTTNSAVDFTSTVNDGTSNTHSLTVSAGSGLITFGSTVGTTELASLAATSTTGIDVDGSVTTGGMQTYTGPVVIGANDTLTTTNSAVDFTSTVNDGTSNTHSLTVSAGSGLITFGSTVGTTELASLAATSTTGIDLDGSVTTGGNQTYTGPVVIGANDTLTTTNSAVDFTSTINDGTSNTHSLTVSAGSGLVTFGSTVGTTELASLSATSSTGIDINGSVTTGSTQTYTGPVVIGANDTMSTTNSAVDFTSTVNDGTSDTHSLTLSAGSGLVTFGSTVGTTELASLAATSTTGIDVGGSVTTGGTQTYTGPVVIGGNDTLTTTNSAVDFTSTINDGTSNTHSLTVSAGSGLVTFGSTVGTTELASLAASSSTGIDVDGSVTTGGTQTYTGPVVIGANETLTTTNSAVDFTSTVNDGTSNTHSLTVSAGSGLITFGSTVGTTELASLAATSTTCIDVDGSVTTGGTQTYTGPVVIGANGTLTTTNSAVDFTSTVNDGTSNTHSLTVSAGSGLITFGSTVGTTELASLAATSTTGIDVDGSVTTGGMQTYTGPVVIGANDTLTTTNSAVDFTSTVNDGTSNTQSLTVSAGSGLITFGSTVGTTELASLAATSTTGIDLDGNVTTGGTQTYTGPVVIGGNDTLTTTNSAVDFTSTINDGTSDTHSLTVSAGSGLVTFGSTVGTTELASLAATSTTGIDMNGSITTGGTQTYTGPVVIGNNETLTTTNSAVDFTGTLDGAHTLAIDTGTGNVSFSGVVGGNNPLTSLNVDPATIYINADVNTAGNQVYDGNVVLTGSVTLNSNSSSAGGNITFDDKVDGDGVSGRSLTLTSGTGTDTFDGVVGTTPLSSLADTASHIDLDGGSITTTGNQTYTGAVPLGTNTTLSSSGGTIGFTSTVDGDDNLTASANAFSFGGAIGGGTPLDAVSLTSTNALTLPAISATSIVAQTTGATSDITIGSGSILTASGSNTAITLASAYNFINDEGSGALDLTGGGRWLIYSTNPADNTLDGLTGTFDRYSCTYGGSCPSFPSTGNGLLYSYTPTLTATPTGGIDLSYGDSVPSLNGYSYSLTGYLTGELSTDNVTGSLNGSTNYTQGSSAGNYSINYSSGSLASALGYGFSYANNSTGITVTGSGGGGSPPVDSAITLPDSVLAMLSNTPDDSSISMPNNTFDLQYCDQCGCAHIPATWIIHSNCNAGGNADGI